LVTGIFIAFAEELGTVIYASSQVGTMLRLLAPLVPLIYFDRIVDGMLKGLNQQVSSLKYDIMDSLTRIAMVYYLIPVNGFQGFIMVIFAGNILNFFLSTMGLLRVTDVKLRAFHWFVMPVLSIIGSGFLALRIFEMLPYSFQEGTELAVKIALTGGLYLGCLLWFQCISREDLAWFRGIFVAKKL